MKIVADTNILFSILIKPLGKTNELFNSLLIKNTIFIAERTLAELLNHHNKILKLTTILEDEVLILKKALIERTQIILGKDLSNESIISAKDLVKDIDIDDTAFVATAIFLKAILWSGDKPLKTGLLTKGYYYLYDSVDIQTLL